jgi:methyl-accepting chemotaxis protein
VGTYAHLAKVSVPNLGHISGMRARGRQIHAESIKLALFWDQQEEVKKTLESLNKALNRYEEISKEKLAEPFSPGEEEVYKVVEEKYAPVRKSVDEILTIFRTTDPDKVAKIKTLLLQFEEQVREHQSSLLKLDDYHVEMGHKWSTESSALAEKMRYILLGASLLTLVFAVLISISMTKNINAILKSIAERLSLSSDHLSKSSGVLTEASESLSIGTSQQAEALHETVTSTNEIAAMTQRASENSRESLSKIALTKNASEKGSDSVQEMIGAINDIRKFTHELNETIQKGNQEITDLVALINKIGEKTRLIDDIVFQTKLLAFNVSVEAARIGDHGKGFAVVSQQMSSLAEISGNASKEIGAMLNETIQKASEVSQTNEQNMKRVITVGDEKTSTGSRVAVNCKRALDEINTYIAEMCDMINETAQSSEEQTKGISEINNAMSQIDEVASKNTENSKSCSDAAVVLMDEVEKTRDIIKDLTTVINGREVSA